MGCGQRGGQAIRREDRSTRADEAPEELLRRSFLQAGFPLAASQLEQFATYLRELLRWNRRINLTALREEDDVIQILFIPSVEYSLGHDFTAPCRVMDMGSGAGIPGLPLKICFPPMDLTLVERSPRKVAFLRHICRSLGLEGLTCIAAHTNDLLREAELRETFDVVVTRGTGRLGRAIEATFPFLREGGELLCLKGEGYNEEVSEAEPQMARWGAELRQSIALPERGSSRRRTLLVVEKCST